MSQVPESPKEKSGGLAYDVILKPASTDSPKPSSPPSGKRPLSQDEIDQKLKEAEARRRSLEAQKLESIARDRARAEEALNKIQLEEKKFSEKTAEKVNRKLQTVAQKREEYLNNLLEKLRIQEKRVLGVKQMSENYSLSLKEKINENMEKKTERKEKILNEIQERMRDHKKHVEEVRQASKDKTQKLEENILEKMEKVLENKEKQLQMMVEKLREEREKKAVEVRQKRLSGIGDAPCELEN